MVWLDNGLPYGCNISRLRA